MTDWNPLELPALPAELPEFGPGPQLGQACTPHELFRALALHSDEHPEYLRPAFAFARAALSAVAVERLDTAPVESEATLDAMVEAAMGRAAHPGHEPEDPSWAVALAKEFAPVGLTDGAWLAGSVMANAVECEVGMRVLGQLMIHLGDPGSGDSHARRYERLLQSIGFCPDPLLEAEGDRERCLDVSYEHALLGLALGRFPTLMREELLGFNLWMTAVGPCPILERRLGALQQRGACLRYWQARDRRALRRWAREAVLHALQERGASVALPRVQRGFFAAHDSYLRWASAASERAGAQTGLAQQPVALAGVYVAADDPDELRRFALSHYPKLSNAGLYHRFANADLYPAVSAFARPFVTRALDRLRHAFDSDERLESMHPPAYSERGVADMVAANHDRNVARRKYARTQAPASGEPVTSGAPASETSDDDDGHYIGALFDGCWLQGFADAQRAGFEEYAWLFRIYASEHGDGDLAWNHSRIFNLAFAERGLLVPWAKTDPRLYEAFDVAVGSIAKIAISLDTRHFLPELLGLNLGIEASGVGGGFMDTWKTAEKQGRPWQALAARLHNSIDNYADGHTKWSLFAVQAYLRRVKDAAPEAVDPTWHRIWRLWRVQEILSHGSASVRAALAEHIDLKSLVPA